MNVVPFARGQPASDYSECGGKTQVLRQLSSLKFSRALSELSAEIVDLIERLIELIPWPARRRAMGDITVALLDGKQRVAEDVFGWNRRRAMGFSGMSVLVQDVLKARTCQRFPACIEKQFRNRRSPTYCKRVFSEPGKLACNGHAIGLSDGMTKHIDHQDGMTEAGLFENLPQPSEAQQVQQAQAKAASKRSQGAVRLPQPNRLQVELRAS